MRKLFLIAFLLLVATPARATFTVTLLAHVDASSVVNTNCGGTGSCWSVALSPSTTAGAMLMIGLAGGGLFQNSGCYDAGDTFTMLPNMAVSGGGGNLLGCWIASVSGSKTTIFINTTSATPAPAWVYQATYTSGPVSLDGSGSATDATCTTCAGVTPTITGTNDVVFQFASCATTCSTITQGYTRDNTDGDGGAYLANTTNTTAPNWTVSPTGITEVAYASFKESSSTVGPNFTIGGKAVLGGAAVIQ
jgi:hypothetical protein